jgi:ribosomal-protein-alanine N-acetyltransferase
VVRLTPGLLEEVRRIERESFANPWEEDALLRVLGDAGLVCLGLRLGHELIGYAVGQVDGVEFHLASLAIAAAHRRRGWGCFLLRETMARARERGCCRCRLEVRARNGPALGLYRREGFAQVDRWPDHYVRPREDALVMQRGLPAGGPERAGCSTL